MKALKINFDKITILNPHWSSLACFATTIWGRNFGKQTITRWFNKLVEIDDYDRKDKKEILVFLFDLSHSPKTLEDD